MGARPGMRSTTRGLDFAELRAPPSHSVPFLPAREGRGVLLTPGSVKGDMRWCICADPGTSQVLAPWKL